MRHAGLTAALLGLSACATQSVTLLPGEPGRPVGALAVLDAQGGEQGVIADADTGTALGGGFHPRRQSPAAIDRRYATLIGDLPPPPEHFTLGFDIGISATAGSDQEAVLRLIFASAAARPGAEVQVVGHTDRLGTASFNDTLSRNRAYQVRAYLIARGLPAEQVRATWRGEREPLVDTPDGVGDARNRRVEVIVR